MDNYAHNQSDSHTELSQTLINAALMFEQLPPEMRKALIELVRQLAVKS